MKGVKVKINTTLLQDYKFCEYIENPNGAYIQTGLSISSTFGGYAEAMLGTLNHDTYMIANIPNGNGYRFLFVGTHHNCISIGQPNILTGGGHISGTPDITAKHTFTLNYLNSGKATYDSNEITSSMYGVTENTSTIRLFYSWQGTNVGRFYNVKFSEGSEIIRNFIPVYKKATYEYGMYDLVEGKFYGSANSKKLSGKLLGGGNS